MIEIHIGRDSRGNRYAIVDGAGVSRRHIRRYSEEGKDRGFFCSVEKWNRFLYKVVSKKD
jgi:hypothetical protein